MATVTIAEIHEILDQIGRSMKESDKLRAESDRVLAESRAESEKYRAESDRLRAETEYAMKELAVAQKKTESALEKLSAQVGGVNNSIGEIVQMIIIPGVMGNMNDLGHNFTMASAGKEYRNAKKETLTEVDLLLENCQDVMVVEVKTQVSLKWVKKHLARLNILRKNESITGMVGKTMYAAIAGINFDEDARDLAEEEGMYLITIKENEDSEDRIDILPPKKAGKW